MKRLFIRIRTWIKFIIIVSIATLLISGIVAFIYKPIYKVTLNGEEIGYCAHKSELQKEIEDYIENGDSNKSNVAFVQIDEMPTYEMCLLKRNITTNDDEIFEKIKQTGTTYYKYYAILEDDEEKNYVSDFATAEAIIQGLKDKDSSNVDNIKVIEKYETELANFVQAEEAIASLYKEKEKVIEQPVVKVASSRTTKSSSYSGSTGEFSTSINLSRATPSLGNVSLIKPITGTITSRFGASSSIRSGAHTGLDISASQGTAIQAASSGTVIWAGYKGSYGNLVVIEHSSSVQTYYGHCSKLYVSAGENVSQGETIAAVGSTGNSTGPHLHFEIRVNGVAYNPQNYLY